ncbi:hypothetical protein B0H13DRAFT_2447184 [Mycena leptocephala]|nr:hypothetical protein B0H13DRAFT_2447184 [Mycena leptocephala]
MLALTIIPLLSLLPGPLSCPIFGLGASTGAPTPVSLDVVNSTLHRPAQFARVAYCSSASITMWTYGAPCDALKNITFLQSGAVRPILCLPSSAILYSQDIICISDEGLVPLYYIAHDADDQSLVVPTRGRMQRISSPSSTTAIRARASERPPLPRDAGMSLLLPRIPTKHHGARRLPADFERTADSLLAGVMDGLKSTIPPASLSFFLVIDLDRRGSGDDDSGDDQGRGGSVCGRVMTGFGLPRGGNQGGLIPRFAGALRSCLSSSSFPPPLPSSLYLSSVPSPPFPPFGLRNCNLIQSNPPQPSSAYLRLQPKRPRPDRPAQVPRVPALEREIHIVDDSQTNLVACPGQDNANCATGNNVLAVSVQNHLGPYFNDITFGGSQCSS